jgi:DNA gyrase subunit B
MPGEKNVVYDASTIVLLPGLEAVRRMPAMYIGSVSRDGVHRLLLELIDNAVDEAAAGHCDRIMVTLRADGSCSVQDNGRGIPIDNYAETGQPTAELLLTTLHSGGKFGSGAYGASAGLHGVGLACVNALSAYLTLDIWRNGRAYRQAFAQGRATSGLMSVPADYAAIPYSGTRVTFLPDSVIFNDLSFEAEAIARRLRDVSYLLGGLTLELIDQRNPEVAPVRQVFQHDSGMAGLLIELNESAIPVHLEPLVFSRATNDIRIDVALRWTENHAERLYSFVNTVNTDQHGTHVDGLHRAICCVVQAYARARAGARDGLSLHDGDVLEGLVGVISVNMDRPTFDGQTKRRLDSTTVASLVEEVIVSELSAMLDADPGLVTNIVSRAIAAQRARMAARLAPRSAVVNARQLVIDYKIYQQQFGIRSKNWHDSCSWLTDEGLLSAHADLCEVPAEARMLDVCCGSGVVGNAFKSKVSESVGLDITPEMVTLASERLDTVHQGTVYDLQFEDATFDLAVNREVLHLLPQPWRPLSEIFRVLRPGGQFIVGQIVPYTDIDAFWMYRIFKKKQPLLYQMFTEKEFRKLLFDTGFTEVRMVEYFLWESIDRWIDTVETTSVHRQEILQLFYNAPKEVRDVHPFKVGDNGSVEDQWRWCVYSMRKPGTERRHEDKNTR